MITALKLSAIVALFLFGYAMMAYSGEAVVRRATLGHGRPHIGADERLRDGVAQALTVRGVVAGRPFPYDIGGRFWKLRRNVTVTVHGSHVTLELDVEPM